MVEHREIEMGHARALLGISDKTQQLDAARVVAKKGLSVRETEQLVRQMLNKDSTRKPKAAPKNTDILRLEQDMTDKLGAKVRIDHTAKGSGKLVITYNSLDELDGILGHIK